MDTANNPPDSLDQADEEILTHTMSDEALEAAAGAKGMGVATFEEQGTYPYYCC